MNNATQMVHQQTLFFVLPFFIAVTNWNHSQALFTSMLILCAIVSVVDPLYYKHLVARCPLFVFYHALALCGFHGGLAHLFFAHHYAKFGVDLDLGLIVQFA